MINAARNIALHEAKDAYRLLMTRGVKNTKLSYQPSTWQWLYTCSNGYDVFLNENGNLVSTVK